MADTWSFELATAKWTFVAGVDAAAVASCGFCVPGDPRMASYYPSGRAAAAFVFVVV